jgi:hypothetical protein
LTRSGMIRSTRSSFPAPGAKPGRSPRGSSETFPGLLGFGGERRGNEAANYSADERPPADH